MFQDMFSSRDKQKIKWKKSERNKKKIKKKIKLLHRKQSK